MAKLGSLPPGLSLLNYDNIVGKTGPLRGLPCPFWQDSSFGEWAFVAMGGKCVHCLTLFSPIQILP